MPHCLIKILTTVALTFFSSMSMAKSNLKWMQVDIGIIGTASQEVLTNALGAAEELECAGLLIKLDTPGGSLEATRDMVKQIMDSDIPIVVWVGPSGSRAGSAGAFITISAHVAAMAPGTNIGAATPIQSTGEDIQQKNLAKKIENDTAAFMESIANTRGRNSEMAVSFVLSATSITADEALKNNVVDLLASSRADLFSQLDGRVVKLANGQETTIESDGIIWEIYEPSLREKFLGIISNPNLFYLLFLAGMIGLGFELTHPGSLFPGVVGGICLILALMATSTLPVSFGSMILILAGIAFLIAELFIPSFGILGFGGFAAFVIGSILLVDPQNEQGLRISLWLIIPGALVVGLTALGAGTLVLKSANAKTASGQESLIGQLAIVSESFADGTGRIHVNGEDWAARCQDQEAAFTKGDEVLVESMNGLQLVVTKKSSTPNI